MPDANTGVTLSRGGGRNGLVIGATSIQCFDGFHGLQSGFGGRCTLSRALKHPCERAGVVLTLR